MEKDSSLLRKSTSNHAMHQMAEVQRTMQRSVLDELTRQASSSKNVSQARAVLTAKLLDLADWLESVETATAHQELAAEDIVIEDTPEGPRWRRR